MSALAIVRKLVERHELPVAPGHPRAAERDTFESELATVCSALFDREEGSFSAAELRLLKALGVPRKMVGGETRAR